MSTSVGIVGCGPAAMLAAYAVDRLGHEPVIMAPKQKSTLSPAQCLQQHIPDVPVKPIQVFTARRGAKEIYAQKLYGDEEAPCSWDKIVDGTHLMWPLDKVYDWLWERYHSCIDDTVVMAEDLEAAAASLELVINTAPAKQFCVDARHQFRAVPVQVYEQPVLNDPLRPTVVYSGYEFEPWYRYSALQRVLVWEYPHDHDRTECTRGIKPVSNNCFCHPEVHRIGRFGKWYRGVQNHHAFRDTVAVMATIGLGQTGAR